ncbi:MAG: hypothetical protein Q8S19_10725 [Bacillota bacterium]|nr:hypothetical protein [Bacillota bacterium]
MGHGVERMADGTEREFPVLSCQFLAGCTSYLVLRTVSGKRPVTSD